MKNCQNSLPDWNHFKSKRQPRPHVVLHRSLTRCLQHTLSIAAANLQWSSRCLPTGHLAHEDEPQSSVEMFSHQWYLSSKLASWVIGSEIRRQGATTLRASRKLMYLSSSCISCLSGVVSPQYEPKSAPWAIVSVEIYLDDPIRIVGM